MRTPQQIEHNKTIPGFMSSDELDHLDSLASGVPAGGIVVELGSLHGRSGYCIATSNTDIILYCVDVWRGINPKLGIALVNSLEVFQHFTKECPNIIAKHIVPPNEVNVEWDDTKVDMVFIDAGRHQNPMEWEIIQYRLPKIKPGGILSGHDCEPRWPDIVANVGRLERQGYDRLPMRTGSSIWSFRIT